MQGLMQDITWEIMFPKGRPFYYIVKDLYVLMYQNDVCNLRIENIANYVLSFPRNEANLKVSLGKHSI
jgi:hypothetical protein